MIGQGGPQASRAPVARRARARPWLRTIALACLAWSSTTAALAAEATMQLRVAWGGGVERTWHGSIRLSQGRFSQIAPLGIEANEPGSIWLGAEGIEIAEPSPRAYDGVDVLVTADVEARLTISLADDASGISQTVEIPLGELVYQAHSSQLDDADNRVLVTRSPGDRLRVRCDRDQLVFSPGEMFKFELAAYLVNGMSDGYRYSATITTSPGGQRMWSQEYEAGAEGTATTITIRVPDFEGVYDLSIAAVPTSLRARLYPKKTLAERKIQFVVLDARPLIDAGEGPLAKVLEINPVSPRWWDRLGNIPLLPGLRKGPLGNGDAAPWEHPTLGPMIQLGPGGTAPNISWEAYPLPISKPGVAHVLEIEYPSDVPQAMGISVIEPNAAGAVMPIGLDSGLYVSDEEAENFPRLARHRVIFWPRTKTPIMLVTNRRQGSRAVYGKITVLSAAHSQFAGLPLPRPDALGTLGPAFTDKHHPDRLWAGYLDRPLFAENFSAPEAIDASNHRSLDDWNTMYQGAVHLVRYLKYVGYNGLMMSAYADGSTIYPSRIVEPTPRYDTGVFFATGQDPMRKDALELLFRLFDREGLTLIPALHFASPLPELEALKRAGGRDAEGIDWIGADGATLLASHAPRHALAPYYNLLDPRVQEAMLRVAQEVAVRYAAHPSFGGLALQLSAEGYAQLPGAEWGFDDQTIARFEDATKTKVPGAGAERFAERAKYLTGPGRTAWLEWRAAVVTSFHRRVQREIAAVRPQARLYLAGGTMLENRQTQFRLRPTLPKRAKLDEALMELGIRAQAYQDDDKIVLLRPHHLKPTSGPLPSQATDLEVNLAPEMDVLFSGSPQPGSLFYHEPQKARLTSFDLKSPFGPANTYTWLVSQMSPAGDRNRRRFIHSLATLDAQVMFDGGWLLPLGQESALKDVLSAYRQLPGERFETVPGELQPVTIRRLVQNGRTFVYLVNDSPWEVGVTTGVELPPNCTLEKLGGGPGAGPLAPGPSGTTWQVTLAPYDLVAARFSAPNVQLRGPRVTISEQVRLNLQQRIQDLGARVAALKDPRPLAVLENPDFESPGAAEEIPGWTVSDTLDSSAQLDTTQKHGGGQSLKLTCGGQPVSITSRPFQPPTTGRVSVELWLRAGEDGLPSVRIALEGQLAEGRFDPYGVIPPVEASGASEWVRYSFPIDDVPAEGLSNIAVRLDVLTAGEVWVDDIQVFDLSFTETERTEILKLISLASVKLEAGQLADCARLLEGYWPQFLVTNVPLTQSTAPLAERPTSPVPATPPEAQEKSGVLESLKEYLPRIPKR